ncbi:MAG: DUF1707 domain-containing protein [Friedmanniella sp.]
MYRNDGRAEQRPELRLSDADREDAIARLSEHYAAGRLDKDEFDERSDAVWTARTGADLAPIFADLAAPRSAQRPGPRGPWVRRGWFPVPFVPVLFVLIALTVLTHIPFVLLAFAGCFLLLGRRRGWRSHW